MEDKFCSVSIERSSIFPAFATYENIETALSNCIIILEEVASRLPEAKEHLDCCYVKILECMPVYRPRKRRK